MKNEFKIIKNITYLDSAATTQKPNRVINKISEFYEKYNSNVHRGIYDLSIKSDKLFENSRNIVSRYINSDPEEIIFTRNTTESLNIIANLESKNLNKDDEVILSISDHHSNILPWQVLSKKIGFKLVFAELNSDYQPNIIENITNKTKIISVSHISNVTGKEINLNNISNEIKNKKIKLILDAAQSASHKKIDVKKMNIDYLAFSGHKIFGPTGIGILYAKKENLENNDPLYYGGDMIKSVTKENFEYNKLPNKFESGTPNISGAIGLGESIEFVNEIGIKNINKKISELTSYAMKELSKIKNIKIYGGSNGIISFNLEGIHSHDVAEILNQEGICIRAGHHCCMPLMNYLGINSCARISIQYYNNKSDIDKCISGLNKVEEIFNG
ncbi:MAG: cysteine desulfurase [Candidatus Woesearchaeota archaeon]